MLYFIPWVVFLLFMILLVPITMVLDKRKSGVHMSDEDEAYADDEFAEEGGEEFGEEEPIADDGGFGGDDFGGAGDDFGGGEVGGEDFSAFDDM